MARKQTGSLVWRPSGWFGRYWVGADNDRKRVFVDLETKNRAIARQKLDALITAAEGAAPTTTGPETLEAAIERVHLLRARTLVSAKTEVGCLRKHVVPQIGKIPAVDVTKADVLAVLEAVRDEGKSQQTIVHVRNAIVAVYRQLRREGVVEAAPVPPTEDLPECLPEAIDDRPNATLEDSELLWYLAHTEPRKGERFRGPVRERQLAGLLCRCVGGMRTGEVLGLTWARVGAEANAFEAIEVVRYKVRRKGARAGNKLAVRQLYTIGDTVLPAFLRFWWLRTVKLTKASPDLDAPVFPVRRAKRLESTDHGAAADRTGQRRGRITWAAQSRRDVQAAFRAARALGAKDVPAEGSRRWTELFVGTEDRRPMWFHSNRGIAADRALRNEISKAAARVTGHASGAMMQHYRERIGAVDVVPVVPQFLPDAEALRAVLRTWCLADGIDPALVFGEPKVAALVPECQLLVPETNEVRTLPSQASRTSLESLPFSERAIGFEPTTFSLGIVAADEQPNDYERLATHVTREMKRDRASQSTLCQNRSASDPAGVVPLPARGASMQDLLFAIDAALIRGDSHGARRLVAEGLAKLARKAEGPRAESEEA